MRISDLFDCFDRHLHNLEILSESEDLFAQKVLEDYIINLGATGIALGAHAEDIYADLQEDVIQMLRKKIYGFYDVDEYRDFLRHSEAA